MPRKRSTTTLEKPVRRAKQARSKATVESIIEAAAQILSDQGWASINTNVIAKKAGVSIGSVYEYFPNKRAIVDAVLDRHLKASEYHLKQAASAVGPDMKISVVIQLLVAGFISLHEDDPELHKTLSSEIPLTKAQQTQVEVLRSKTIDLVTLALANQVSEPKLKATLLVDTADALAHRWVIDEVGTPLPPSRMAKELETMLGLYVENTA